MRAFELLFERISPRVEASLLRFLRSDADAASAALQDAWSAASQRLSEYESAEHLIRWLHRVARCRAISGLRKRHGTITTSWQECCEEDPGPQLPAIADTEGDRELSAMMRAAIASLPDTYRGIATLYFVYGRKPREVALLHGLSPGTVKMRLHRARLRLRRTLASVAPP